MSQLFDLTGKTALLTGASRGMGLAMAEALAAHGARVMLSSRHQEACDVAAEAINRAVGAERAIGVACNAGAKEQLQSLVEAARERLGPIDIVIGNAAVNVHYGPMAGIGDAAYDKIMATNVHANLWLAQLAAPYMAERGGGSMIFTSSVGAFLPSTGLGAYNISKLALIGLVRNLAAEFGPAGVRVNALCPGLIRTDFSQALWDDEATAAEALRNVPLGRLGEADDFKGIAVYLASAASSYMTGQVLTVCGGSYMWR